uniref:Uncharacterized protein n=1 Tax=Coccidioides posadasii RMSCC 3488 TaxID=454284 RepID=A0A0J6FN39_COCPO|nr:hypothetical protein CPAG_08084 [Coccidioides posadasii RMSCC 3488]
MWLRARVRAPAIMVEVAELTEAGEVVARRALRLRVSCSSTMRKGRYLLDAGLSPVVEDMATSPSVSAGSSWFVLDEAVVGVGYSHRASWEWLATTATLFA